MLLSRLDMCAMQVHQLPTDHDKCVGQQVTQVVQQPRLHQPTATAHHHLQQLEPLAQQLSIAKDGSCAHMAELPPEVCLAATALGHLSGIAAAPAATTAATVPSGTVLVQSSEHPVCCKTEASLAEGP